MLLILIAGNVDGLSRENDRRRLERLRAVGRFNGIVYPPHIFLGFKFIVVCVRYSATVIREESGHARMKL